MEEDFKENMVVMVAMVEGEVGADRGEVMGGGVDFRVSRSLLGGIPEKIMGDKVREELRVDRGSV
nr:hypothetical protein [Tanacetum cinerariifolium]